MKQFFQVFPGAEQPTYRGLSIPLQMPRALLWPCEPQYPGAKLGAERLVTPAVPIQHPYPERVITRHSDARVGTNPIQDVFKVGVHTNHPLGSAPFTVDGVLFLKAAGHSAPMVVRVLVGMDALP